ncbi:hypothetical protein RI543_001939 [Arxiozyma heterogenica]|uniref:FCP1 homology domain-containing protein n=1 Tax=Arxiozyma heterogenica TaxID=278026 RepID=A0AAN7W464_9SACH|nr:hypothetical protein RI543_001939 [Kazachstania heterogenica]
MSLFSSILCCTSDITSDNIDNNNSGNNRNRNSHIRTDNKDYSKKVSVYKNTNNNSRSIQNKEMISKRDKNRNNRNIDKPVISNKEQQSSEKNTKSETKFMKRGSTKDDNDVILADIEYANEEKDYEDSDDMDIDDEVALIGGGSNDNYKTKLNSNENQNNNNNSNGNNNYDANNNDNDGEYLKNKEKHTINVYTNETDRSTGSSDYGYMHQQQQQQQLQQENLENELSQLTTISSNENDIPSPNIVAPSSINNNTPKTLNANNEINNNIHENNINTEPVISTTLTISDTNTTTNLPSPISSSDQNDISMNTNNSNDDIDYDMMHPFDENEEFVDLTMLQPNQYHAPGFNTLLSPKDQVFKNKKLLVLDLDETLVHSSFKYLRSADFVLPVDIDDQMHNVYVIKRPGVDEFLKKVGELFEVVVFTASVNRYGDPLLDILDKHKSIHHRLFREACYNYEGNYIKNLSQLGRPLSDIIILDNSPASYIFHPQHAIPISSWFSDTHDNELLDIIPLLEDLAKQNIIDVGKVLDVSI